MRQADQNFEKLKTESERLEQHTKKSVNWLLWLMLILVSFTFISMILFIRIFPRLRWWLRPRSRELFVPHPPVFTRAVAAYASIDLHSMSVCVIQISSGQNQNKSVWWTERDFTSQAEILPFWNSLMTERCRKWFEESVFIFFKQQTQIEVKSYS